jgi:uncharacterized protein (TIGR04255 family)
MIKFANPPLSEVVFGIEFADQDFSSVHFGLYWQAIRANFPSYFDRPPLASPNVFTFSNLPPLRRVWFESLDKQELIQLQPARFIYNWRRLDTQNDYPSFEVIYPQFLSHWQHFQSWWQSEIGIELQPLSYALTYTNEIGSEQGWSSTEDHPKIFSFINPNSADLHNKRLFNAKLELELEENMGILIVDLNQAINPNKGLQIAVLELTAISQDQNISLETWFEKVHDKVVDTFLQVMTEDIKQKWGLYD